MSFFAIFNPMVRAHFENKLGGSGGADDLIVAMATRSNYELKSDAVTSVGHNAFVKNGLLTFVDFPNAVSVGSHAFNSCNSLVDINLPKVATIGESAFELCKFKEANFPMATQIGDCAFSSSEIMNANFPKVEIVPSNAFSSCKLLTKINAPLAATIYDSAFANCENLTSVNCPAVSFIGNHAFSGCGCEKLDFPVVTNIGEGAFAGCSNLTAVIVRTTSKVCAVDFTALNGTPAMSGKGHVYVPASMYEAYRETYAPTVGATMFNAIFRKIEDYPEICGVS
jgi:hypothetical protein